MRPWQYLMSRLDPLGPFGSGLLTKVLGLSHSISHDAVEFSISRSRCCRRQPSDGPEPFALIVLARGVGLTFPEGAFWRRPDGGRD